MTSTPVVNELVALRNSWGTCDRCGLAATRTNLVFGTGNVLEPPILFVGEAPGKTEDTQGVPFVGRAGKLLTTLIEEIGLSREQVYICNPVMCRPPQNRPPFPEEIQRCKEAFETQIRLVKPKTIMALGKTAAGVLLGDVALTMRGFRGKWHSTAWGPVRVTYHPAYLLRNITEMSIVREDFFAVRKHLDAILMAR